MIDRKTTETRFDGPWIQGRDATLPPWITSAARPDERPRYDSVVIRGNGVGALTLAGRLARSPAFAGKVVVAAPRPVESRKLVNGCTLRARSLDYYAAAFATTRQNVVETLFGPRHREAEVHRQFGSMSRSLGGGEFVIENCETWMDAKHSDGRPIAYGIRNGRLVGALADLLAPLSHQWIPELPKSLEDCRRLAPGKNPIVLNATHESLEGVPPKAAPTHFVVASQMTFTAPRRRAVGLVADHGSFVSAVPREGALDTGVYYPFVDPLSPLAEYYGIFYRIVTPGPGFDKAAELARLRDTVVGVGRAFGLEPHDEHETGATAMVPCSPWHDDVNRHRGYVDFEAIYGAGTPIITGCGMSRAGVAGYVAAEAILHGADPVALTNAALIRWRRLNRAFATCMTTLSTPVAALVRRFPGLALNFVVDWNDTWAGVAGAPVAAMPRAA